MNFYMSTVDKTRSTHLTFAGKRPEQKHKTATGMAARHGFVYVAGQPFRAAVG